MESKKVLSTSIPKLNIIIDYIEYYYLTKAVIRV